MNTPATEPNLNPDNALRPLSAGGNFAALAVGCAAILCGAFLLLIGPIGLPGTAACYVAGTVGAAMLFGFGRGAWRLAAFAAVAVTALYAGVIGVTFGLAVILSAILLAIGALKSWNRFEVGAGETLAVSLMTLLGVAAILYQSTGSFGTEAIAAVADTVIDTLLPLYEEYVNELSAISPGSEMIAVLSDTVAIEKVLRSVLNRLPAYFGAVVSCLCYLTTVFFSRRAERVSRPLPSLRMFAIPTALAVPFIVTLMLGVFVSGDSVAGLVIEYISILLTPGFAYVGLRGVWQTVKTRFSSTARVIAILLGLFLAVSMLGYVLTLLALFGAFTCLRVEMMARMNMSR